MCANELSAGVPRPISNESILTNICRVNGRDVEYSSLFGFEIRRAVLRTNERALQTTYDDSRAIIRTDRNVYSVPLHPVERIGGNETADVVSEVRAAYYRVGITDITARGVVGSTVGSGLFFMLDRDRGINVISLSAELVLENVQDRYVLPYSVEGSMVAWVCASCGMVDQTHDPFGGFLLIGPVDVRNGIAKLIVMRFSEGLANGMEMHEQIINDYRADMIFYRSSSRTFFGMPGQMSYEISSNGGRLDQLHIERMERE